MKRTLLALAASVALAGCLSACETTTPYQPLNAHDRQAGGYSDTKVTADHWRVTFSGNTLTSRETVERYLLYRAAELTTSQGFDWFVTADKQTDKKTDTFLDPIYGYGWAPSWRFYRGRGWGGWGGWGYGRWGDPFGEPAFADTYSRYEVSAEIVMGHGAKPQAALDAREVMMNLGPQIQRPKA